MYTLSKVLALFGLDTEDLRVIAAGIIVILIVGLLLALLAAEMGIAITIFEKVRGI